MTSLWFEPHIQVGHPIPGAALAVGTAAETAKATVETAASVATKRRVDLFGFEALV